MLLWKEPRISDVLDGLCRAPTVCPSLPTLCVFTCGRLFLSARGVSTTAQGDGVQPGDLAEHPWGMHLGICKSVCHQTRNIGKEDPSQEGGSLMVYKVYKTRASALPRGSRPAVVGCGPCAHLLGCGYQELGPFPWV